MAQIVPAILEETKEGFVDKVSRITKLPGVERIQVDFADGIFVPHKLLVVNEIDALNPAFHWEAHLMVEDPQDFLDYNICGFKTILVHFEAYKKLSGLKKAIQAIKALNIEPGVCLQTETQIDVVKDLLDEVKHFSLMGIEKPGYQGMPFLETTYKKITELRTIAPRAIIEIDGGVNFDDAKQLAQVGADLLIAGSVLTKADNLPEAWDKLQILIMS